MIEELDTVVLTRDLPEHRLAAGDIGGVVHRYPNGVAFEVEFVTAGAHTIAVLTLAGDDVRSLREGEILHARQLEPAR
jgi:Domain of unknown function (DUF4926)